MNTGIHSSRYGSNTQWLTRLIEYVSKIYMINTDPI